jgi:hypothetical protein
VVVDWEGVELCVFEPLGVSWAKANALARIVAGSKNTILFMGETSKSFVILAYSRQCLEQGQSSRFLSSVEAFQ